MINYKSLFLPIILIAVIFCSFKIIKAENERRILKEDLIELSKIKYGLFSVDEWKKILANVISKKIEELKVTDGNRQEMYVKVSRFLNQAIGDYEKRMLRESEKKWYGIIQAPINSYFIDKLRQEIPNFSRQIVGFLDDPENRKAIKQYIISKLDGYADKTFSKIDYSTHNHIILKYHQEDKSASITYLNNRISQVEKQLFPFKVGVISLISICVFFILFSSTLTNKDFLLLTGGCFMLLLAGLLLPMIEIDARITEMKFTLIGEPVSFQDQVLYYKSKSILQVVKVMITQSRLDLLLVGFLVFLFSVLFPVAKLISSLMFIHSEKFKNSKFIRFMVFKTGKWSMADVMVIAIFMSYIGFSGIITEQLKQIEVITLNMEVLTTNKSSLMTGFYFFTAFALLSLLVSHKLQYGRRTISNLD
jgi:hypothetical protein